MSYISNKLTHWVGRASTTDDERYEMLTENIVSKKLLRFSACPIVFNNRYGGIERDALKLPMICFTDAPFSQSESLCSRYSKFAVVFDKAYLANCLTVPVGYALHPYVYSAYSDLYHVLHGLRPVIEGQQITEGKRAGKRVSVDRLLEQLTRLIAFTQDYAETKFEFNVERADEGYDMPVDGSPRPSQLSYFETPDALYFEREWRMALWPDMLIKPYPWLVLQDESVFFQFDAEFVPYLVLPRKYRARLIDERDKVFRDYNPSQIPQILAFEDLIHM